MRCLNSFDGVVASEYFMANVDILDVQLKFSFSLTPKRCKTIEG